MSSHKPDPNRAIFGSPAFVGLMLMSEVETPERQQLGYNLLAASLLIAAAQELLVDHEHPWAVAAQAQARRATQQHQRTH